MLPLQYPSTVYNKLFTRILDSSIWLESLSTRIVWLTFIAVMDEHGYVQFASSANVAHRARVTLEEASEAIAHLEGPDVNSSDPDNEGRRIERVPGGWIVLNAEKHRKLVTRAIIQEQTRERVRKHRAGPGNAPVTPSGAVSKSSALAKAGHTADADYEAFHAAYPSSRRVGGKIGRQAFKTAMTGKGPDHLQVMLAALAQQQRSEQWQTPKLIPLMTTWLNQERWAQVLPEPTPDLSPTTLRLQQSSDEFLRLTQHAGSGPVRSSLQPAGRRVTGHEE